MAVKYEDDVWYRSADGGRPGVTLETRKVSLYKRGNPSYLCRWLKNRSFDVETTVAFDPESSGELAGLALVQNERINYVLGKTLDASGRPIIVLVRHDNDGGGLRRCDSRSLRDGRLLPITSEPGCFGWLIWAMDEFEEV